MLTRSGHLFAGRTLTHTLEIPLQELIRAIARLALFSIQQTDLPSFSEEVSNGYVTNPNPTPTLTPNPNSNPNSNRINKKVQKETTLENR